MMISTRLLRAVFGALALLSAFAPERAVGQPLMTYQGRLKESGVPVNGNRTVEVMLCNCLTGLCAPACTSTGAQGVTVSSGLFRTTFTVPSGVDLAAPPWYLEIKVNASALSPREELTYSPYAVFASSIALNTVKTANIINGAVDSSKLAPSFLSSIVLKAGDTMTGQLTNTSTITVQGNAFSVGGSTFVVSSGNVGIGTTNPAGRLTVASGQILAANGSMGAPAFSFASTPDAGLLTFGASEVYVAASGSARARFNSNGLQIFKAGTSQVYNDSLHVFETAAPTLSAASVATSLISADSSPSLIVLKKARGATTPGVITVGDDLGRISGVGYVGATNQYIDAASILFDSEGPIADSATGIGGVLSLQTRASGGALAERMKIDSNGNVGIGTPSPGEKLTLSVPDGGALRIDGPNVSGNTQRLQFGYTAGFAGKIDSLTKAGGGGSLLFFPALNGTTQTEAMRITDAGNVGIGTTAPGAKLHVSGPSNFEGDVSITTGSASGGAHLRSSQLTSPTGVASNPGCGTGPNAAIAGTDMAGSIQLTSGTGASTTCTVTVTFVRPYVTAPKSVVISPMGPNAGALNAFIQISPTTSGFVLQAANAVTISTQYFWSYIVIE